MMQMQQMDLLMEREFRSYIKVTHHVVRLERLCRPPVRSTAETNTDTVAAGKGEAVASDLDKT